MITQQRLKQLFSYDETTGVFTRKVAVGRHGRYKVGTIAGTKTAQGYIVIGLDDKKCMAHRLAWLYVYGVLPATDLDHINRNKSDNRIANLRLVNRSQNMHNVNLRKHNSSGYNGVSWHKPRRKWRAYIFVDYTQVHLGLFDKISDAIKARKQAERAFGV